MQVRVLPVRQKEKVMNRIDFEFDEFMKLMRETTEKLKKMNEAQAYMRWQFGDPPEYEAFVKEMDEAKGWVSSHC